MSPSVSPRNVESPSPFERFPPQSLDCAIVDVGADLDKETGITMSTLVSLRAVHRSRLAKFFAVCLVALSVSPFTAPFSTFDKAEILGETAVYAGHGSAKLVQEATDVGAAVVSVPELFTGAVCQLAGWVLRIAVRSHRSLVLRI
jgi:hypothetical protein